METDGHGTTGGKRGKDAAAAPAISVVVPVYNVREWLDRCVASILGQTKRDFELILVDDGAADGSGERCDEWAMRDARVRVFHQANAGQAAARNFGVLQCKGAWVAFVDSDDYVAPEYLECLFRLAAEHHAGIAMCPFARTRGEALEVAGNDGADVFGRSEACERMALIDLDDGAAGKLYRRGLLQACPFPEGRIFEDTAVMGRLFYEAERVVRGKRTLYAYFQREGSTIHILSPKAWRDRLWAVTESAEFFDDVGEVKAAAFAWERVRALVKWIMAADGLPLPELREFWWKHREKLNAWTTTAIRCRLRMAAPWLWRLRNLLRRNG